MATLQPRVATHHQEESDWDSDGSENEDHDHLSQAEDRPSSIPVHCPQATLNQSTYLTDLPAEILAFIVGYLDSHHDLLDVALSCQMLRDLVEAPLYRSFPPLHAKTGEPVNTSAEKISKFLLVLVRRPGLVSHVRHLAEPYSVYQESGYQLEPPDHQLIEAAIIQLRLPNQENMIRALPNRFDDALLVLLLLKLPKFQTLRLEDTGHERRLLHSLTNWAIAEAENGRSQLMIRLHRVKIRASRSGDDLIAFLHRYDFLNRLPSLEELTVSELRCRERSRYSSEQLVRKPILPVLYFQLVRPSQTANKSQSSIFPPRSYKASSLHFERCNFGPTDISELLASYTKLKSFMYDVQSCHFDINRFDMSYAMRELRRFHSESVEKLALSAGRYTFQQQEHLGDLKCFTRLKDLKVKQGYIVAYEMEECLRCYKTSPQRRGFSRRFCDGTRPSCGQCVQHEARCDYIPSEHNIFRFSTMVDDLPPSLESLHLWACDDSIFEQMRQLALVRTELVPNLKEIYIEMDSHYRPEARREFQAVHDILQEEGIQFAYGLPRLPSGT